MTPIAKALPLSSDGIADVAAYCASQNAPSLPLGPPDPALVKRGEQLAKIGSAKQRVQACDNCHGPEGAGEPPTIPYLAGQYAHHIDFTLDRWRTGFRKSSPESMEVVAKMLDDQDLAAIVAYYQQVRGSGDVGPPQ
jgi:cytochrome c553